MKSAVVVLCLFAASLYADEGTAFNEILAEHLYNDVIIADYDSAVERSKLIYTDNKGELITNVVNNLIRNNKMNCMEYAYQLWMQGSEDIVRDCFPVEFTLILAENYVKLMYRRDGLAFTLSDNGGVAYGDSKDRTSSRVSWKFIPLWENNKVYFKIENTERKQNLALKVRTNRNGDHMAYGVANFDGFRAQWYLVPAELNNEVLFFIFNRDYSMALTLSRTMDSLGNRMAWGYNGRVIEKPEHNTWSIKVF
ncbi:low molecular mass 30 kDa lipoprotein 19G1-like isoform X1 [Bombyx mori]|uniref:Uncharacterized protein n=1 Tax=Bombyx mori TaxID=7091 RepID=A0A8R2DMK0_BOMMO|nr:low molecular mass 30 kDa lipoprotein 19G1-like isoform X1 [Bombyx mori]XP_021206838.2 low molecular mass 30 kDa lipoprotein 19G1-like isoform X1 [Bombyx mori]